jgi:hypothetical protein
MTTIPIEPEVTVRYEGGAVATEIWGMTQANFIVQLPGRHLKEVGVMLNDAAARFLAMQLGQDDTHAFRLAAARHAGDYLLRKLVGEGRRLDSAITLSQGVLDDNPDILDHLQSTRVQA